MKQLLKVAIAALLCAGCSTIKESGIIPGSSDAVDTRPIGPNGERLNRIPGTLSIDIPQGMPDKLALDTFEKAIAGTGAGDKSLYWASQWRMEARDPENKWIRVSFSNRQHYLSVCYRIENGKMVPDVPTSTNLKQDGIKIHRKVPTWINRLSPLISAKLYEADKASRAQ